MNQYVKPFLASCTPDEIVNQMGPAQTSYAVQFEVWRTSRLNQPKESQMASHTNVDTIYKIDSKNA